MTHASDINAQLKAALDDPETPESKKEEIREKLEEGDES